MNDDAEIAGIENPSAYPPSIQAGIPKLGPTPMGWTRAPLGELLRKIERPAKLADVETYQLVTAKRNRGGIVARETLRGDQIRTKTQFYVEKGDFLISNRQISHGACGVVPAELHRAVVSNEYTAFHTSDLLDPLFLNTLSNSVYFQQTCFHSSVGVHVEKLVFRLEDWLDWEFNIPPLAEQRRIVAIFDAWDRAIDQAERLVGAKRRRWQTLIGEISTNRWGAVALGALGRWVGGGTPSKANAEYWTNGLIPWVSPKDMNGWQINSAEEFITAAAIAGSSTQLIPVGSVLVVTRSGILRTRVPVAVTNRQVAINQDIKALIPENSELGPLIAALLLASGERLRQETMKIGTTVESIDLGGLKAFKIPFPIAEDDADAAKVTLVCGLHEIDSLDQMLAHLRIQKRALMQKLLTGLWRLDERFDPPVPTPRKANAGLLP